MLLFQGYHLHKFDKLIHTDFWRFEFSIWLHVFGRSMVSIFIPIFLLIAEHSISEVIFFYLIFNIFDAPLNFFAKWLTAKIGARWVIIIGTVAYIGGFFCLYFLTAGNWALFILMAFLFAFYDTLYWIAHLYLFMRCSTHDDNVSKDRSTQFMIKKIASMLAPMLGALILIFFKEHVLIIVSVVILAFSVWPLFKIKDTPDKPEKPPMKFREFFKTWDDVKEYLIRGTYSFHNVSELIIWPLFIYILFESIEAVAIIPVIVSVTVIIFSYFTGKIKKERRLSYMAIGSMLIGLVWMARVFVENDIFYYVSIFLVGLFSLLVTLPLDSWMFEKGEKKDALSTSTYRNFFSMWPRIFFYGLLLVLLNVFEVSFISAAVSMFVIMLFASLLMLPRPLMARKKH